MEQDEKGCENARLGPFPRPKEQKPRPRHHGQRQQGGKPAGGTMLTPVNPSPGQGLEHCSRQAGHPQQQADLGVGETLPQEVWAGEGEEDTVGHPIKALDACAAEGGTDGWMFHGRAPFFLVCEAPRQLPQRGASTVCG